MGGFDVVEIRVDVVVFCIFDMVAVEAVNEPIRIFAAGRAAHLFDVVELRVDVVVVGIFDIVAVEVVKVVDV